MRRQGGGASGQRAMDGVRRSRLDASQSVGSGFPARCMDRLFTNAECVRGHHWCCRCSHLEVTARSARDGRMDSRNCANRLTITQAGKSTARTNVCGTRVSGDPGAASFPGGPAAAMRRLTSISLGKTLPNVDRQRSTRGAPPVTIEALGRSRSPVRAPPTAGARPPSSGGVVRDSGDFFPTVASLSRGIRAPAQRPASPRSPSVRARRRMVCAMSTVGDTHRRRRHRRHPRHRSALPRASARCDVERIAGGAALIRRRSLCPRVLSVLGPDNDVDCRRGSVARDDMLPW